VTESHKCGECGSPCPSYRTKCSWDCSIEEARRAGGKEHLPNGLPVRCIKADWTMLEHEHGDHPDYKFPIGVEYVGPLTPQLREQFEILVGRPPADDDELRKTNGETHALVYSDGYVAVTMDECCYAMWYVTDGSLGGGSLWGGTKKDPHWRLSEQALEQIRERFPR
jgi:hypothetical protein